MVAPAESRYVNSVRLGPPVSGAVLHEKYARKPFQHDIGKAIARAMAKKKSASTPVQRIAKAIVARKAIRKPRGSTAADPSLEFAEKSKFIPFAFNLIEEGKPVSIRHPRRNFQAVCN